MGKVLVIARTLSVKFMGISQNTTQCNTLFKIVVKPLWKNQ